MTIGVCLIVTRKYKIFLQPLVDSIKKYFLLRHQIEIHLFIDDIAVPCEGDERVKIIKQLITSFSFPSVTLFRYEIMCGKKYTCDYLYYLDVDYLIASEIDENILGNIVAVLHPGFSVVGGGSWCTDEKSNAYTFPENRLQYFCGGTQGGKTEYYYRAMQRMKREIEHDEQRRVRAEHNDESHWNKLLSELKSFKILNSGYCMVEDTARRVAWGIDDLEVKIVALNKDHKTIRE